MHMEMEDHLTTAPLNIKEQFIAWCRHSLLSSDFSGFQDHSQKNILVRFSDVVEAPEMFFRNHQEVNRSTRMDILKHHKKFIPIEEFSGSFATDYFTEEAIFFHGLPETKDACSGSEPGMDHIPSKVWCSFFRYHEVGSVRYSSVSLSER